MFHHLMPYPIPSDLGIQIKEKFNKANNDVCQYKSGFISIPYPSKLSDYFYDGS